MLNIPAEKLLVILLRLNAAVLLLAIPTIFLPDSTMKFAHEWLGLGEFPEKPITEYLARSCSLLHAVHGFVLLLVALDPRKHWSLIGPLALVHVFIGGAMVFIDFSAGMPWYWTALEGGPIASFGIVVYVVWRIADKRQPS